MHILIAEDDKISRDLMRLFIETEQRHTIIQATNGEEALRILHDPTAGRIDLCILDVMMPRLDGLSLVERIRQTEAIKDTRVILCTALSDRAKVQRAVQLGVLHYIVKPYIRSHILEKIRLVESELAAKESLEDAAVVCERLGLSADAYREMLRTFLDEVRSWLAFARTCDPRTDHESLEFSANGFRGSAMTLGATMLARTLGEIEDLLSAPTGEKSAGSFAVILNALENEVKMILELSKDKAKPPS